MSFLASGLFLSAAALAPSDWRTGDLALSSIGPLAFAQDGTLFLGDPEGAALVALRLTEPREERAPELDIDAPGRLVAQALGVAPDAVHIHDLAVHPASGAAYLSVTRGSGNEALPAVVRIAGPERLTVVDLATVPYMRADLDDAPPVDEGGRRSRRTQTITDLAYHDGVLFVAGLSNEEFASKLRTLRFPFDAAGGAAVEIYHASHGAWETRSPVRSFVPIDIEGEPFLLCGYTCTPLVKIPVSELLDGEKIVGTTVAELGNRNTPLDMVVYRREGATWILIANTSRGVMKMPAGALAGAEGLEDPAEGPAGVGYETIEALQGVTQLCRLDETRALVLVEGDAGSRLAVIDLP